VATTRLNRWALMAAGAAAFLGACPAAALERWVAGAGGEAWDTVLEERNSRNVEVTRTGWLQLELADPDQNLCLDLDERGGWYTGAGGSLIWSGSIDGAFDDDSTTAAIITHSRGRITADLGAPFPVNRIRFYPRPAFPLRFIPGFQVYVNDGTRPPDLSGMDMWTLARVTAEGSINNLIDWEFLYERRENLESLVELSFPRQYTRYVQVADFETSTWEFAALEVYGEGYVGQAACVSRVVDLGGAADFGNLAWSLQLDEGAEFSLRSRSGTTPDPFVYYRLTGIGPTGQTRVEDENGNGTAWDEYNRLRDDRGDMVLDSEHWSFWSPPYIIEAEQEPMASPGPRRYVQFEMTLRAGASFDDGVRLRSLSLEYSRPPLAQRVVGEIAPTVVQPGEETTFTYALAGSFERGQSGFDVLEISPPVAVDPASVRDVTVGGQPVAFEAEGATAGFSLRLFEPVRRDQDVVMLKFDAPVYVPGTRFEAKVFDSAAPQVGQQVVAGDASSEMASDELSVGWALEGDLIGRFRVAPNPVTPNGDGISDAATIAVDVLQLLDAAEVSMDIYDLGGRLIWQASQLRRSGVGSAVWPAVDQSGRTVAPGLYVCRVAVDGAAGRDSRTALIAVAY